MKLEVNKIKKNYTTILLKKILIWGLNVKNRDLWTFSQKRLIKKASYEYGVISRKNLNHAIKGDQVQNIGVLGPLLKHYW